MAEKLILQDLSPSNEMFLSDLSTTIERLYNRHLEYPREFFPTDIADDMDEAILLGNFIPEEAPLSEAVKASLYVNYITEEGLPHYTSTLSRSIPKKHYIRDWVNQWTAEEGRHAPAISHYLRRTKQVDMHLLERARMAMVAHPDTPQPGSFVEALVYPAFQEPATEISHRNTMHLLPQAHKIGKRALGFVVGDEVKHGNFYVDLVSAAIELQPSFTIIAIAQQVKAFVMPGKSMPGFDEYKSVIEKAGIFGAPQLKKIYDELISEKWNIWDKTNLSAEANRARDFLADYLRRMDMMITWAAKKQEHKRIVT
jgi:acyl-[acyl-carrier-protein] desaturase